MPPSIFNLPPLPPELKTMSPYLQRAEELKTKDPIMAYWCAYHAAQVGIGLKVKDPAARSLLFELLGVLERMKKEIGPNDAIDDENASSAFVENFALKVFTSADNEDRRGDATRATAKKFLAAANFLETLSVFDSSSSESSSNTEKIRYAKWKAADIAKAFREGRKPTPGPAGGDDLPPHSSETATQELPPSVEQPPGTPPTMSAGPQWDTASSPPTITRVSPPPPQLGSLPTSPYSQSPTVATAGTSHLFPTGFVDPRTGAPSPGAWSTAATPGSPAVFHFEEDKMITTPTGAWTGDQPRAVDSSGPIAPLDDAGVSPNSLDGSKQVRFSPSVTGGSSVHQPLDGITAEDPFDVSVVVNPPLPPHDDTLFFPPTPSHIMGYNPHLVQNTPLLPSSLSDIGPTAAIASAQSSPSHFSSPNTIPTNPHPMVAMSEASTTTPVPPVELTPQVIARIQKHCKFAISALDYEDAAQARKELREALRMLGG